MIDFYFNEVAQIPRAGHESVLLGFAQGARFAVSRGRIRRRPLRYYQALLAHVSRGVNPKEGGYMEAMWYDVFHPERLQALPRCARTRRSRSIGARAGHDDAADHCR